MAFEAPWSNQTSGAFMVSPGFTLKQDIFRRLLGSGTGRHGGGEEIGMFGGFGSGGGGDITRALLESSLADLGQQEQTKTKALEGRFGSMGRSLTSTAFSGASRDLAESFARARLKARASALETGADIQTRLLQAILGGIGSLGGILGG